MLFKRLFGMAVATLLFVCVTPQSAAEEGRWLRAESTNFIIYSEGAERDLVATVLDLERFDAVLRTLLPPPSAEVGSPLEVYLLGGRRSLARVWPGVSADVAGFYTATPQLVAAFAIMSGRALPAREVLFHEYAHHYMLQHFVQPFPAWFVEGLAEFTQTTRFEEGRAVVGEYSDARAPYLVSGGWLDGDEMFGSASHRFSPEQTARFYAQSWLAVHYLETSPEGARRLRDYLAALGSGSTPEAAFEPAFGVTMNQFNVDLRRYVRGNLPLLSVRTAMIDAHSVETMRLPEAADDLLPLTLQMRRSPDEEEIADISARVERAAAGHAGDPYAMRAQASAALMREDPSSARAILEPLLAADALDREALYLMGSSYLVEARMAGQVDPTAIMQQARRYFARSFRIAPNHYQTLYGYAQTFPLPLDSTQLDVLVRAHLLAPQVAEISLNTARALLSAGRRDEATSLLETVAYAPHGGGASEHARAMLDTARRGEPPQSVSSVENNGN